MAIDPSKAANFGADQAVQMGGGVKVVRYAIPEEFFLDLFAAGHIKQGATTGSLVFDKVAQAAINKAIGN